MRSKWTMRLKSSSQTRRFQWQHEEVGRDEKEEKVEKLVIAIEDCRFRR